MTAILDIMGLKPSDVSDSDTLASMGIDSMQLVEVCLSELPLVAKHRPEIPILALDSQF